MAHVKLFDLKCDGASFIPRILDHPDFRETGVMYGRDAECWWAVIDPRLHPFYVWERSLAGVNGYRRSACTLDAGVFTNGPMMGKRLGSMRKVTRRLAMWEFAKWTSIGAIGGVAIARGRRSRYVLSFMGVITGNVWAWRRIFTGWIPCGAVFGRENGINDMRDFDGEGATHSWFGRFSAGFDSYRIGDGAPPAGVVEGAGGLILLVRGFAPASTQIGHSAFNRDFALLSKKKGVVAWGLIPLKSNPLFPENTFQRSRRTSEEYGPSTQLVSERALEDEVHLDGIIVVIGSRFRLDGEEIADRLCSIGVRDAVAMDQSGSIMMGAGRRLMIRPTPNRQAMQAYGFCCQ